MDLLCPIETIEDRVFLNCEELSALKIPSTVKEIKYEAFSSCWSLETIDIPSQVTTIEEKAFAYCSRLHHVSLPASLTTIGEWAFVFCDKLESVVCKMETPFAISDEVFYSKDGNIYNNATLYVPQGTLQKYQNTEGWRKFIHINDYQEMGIDFTSSHKSTPLYIYSASGKRINALSKGIYMIQYRDGSTRKVIRN